MTKHLLHPDDDGLTALHIAAEHGHADVVLYLIRLGSEENVEIIDNLDNYGRRNGHFYCFYVIFCWIWTSWGLVVVRWIPIKSALHYACEEGKTNAVAALLESGPDIDLQDNEGHTPLHKAAVRGHLAVVKLLRNVFK